MRKKVKIKDVKPKKAKGNEWSFKTPTGQKITVNARILPADEPSSRLIIPPTKKERAIAYITRSADLRRAQIERLERMRLLNLEIMPHGTRPGEGLALLDQSDLNNQQVLVARLEEVLEILRSAPETQS